MQTKKWALSGDLGLRSSCHSDTISDEKCCLFSSYVSYVKRKYLLPQTEIWSGSRFFAKEDSAIQAMLY